MTRKVILSILVFSLSMLAFCINGKTIGSGDTLPTRYLPFSLILEGNFDLEEFDFLRDDSKQKTYPTLENTPYYLRRHGDHYYSGYPVGPAILALPIYLIPVLSGLEPDSPHVDKLAKSAAALIAAFSVLFLFLALCYVTPTSWAAVFSLVYALGTCTLPISSQALWQHGPSQFFLTLMLYFFTRGEKDDRYIPWGSFALSASIAMRSSNALIALPISVLILLRYRRQWLRAALLFLPPVSLAGAYYLSVFGAPLPAFENIEMDLLSSFRQIPFFEGFYGVLFSPARGLFFFSPVLLFSVAGAISAFKTRHALTMSVAVGSLLVIMLVSKWFFWWGGHCYGPRLLADLAPLLCFCLHPLTDILTRRRLLMCAFVFLVLVSFAIQLLGAFKQDGRFDDHAKTDLVYASMLDPRNSPVFFYTADLFGKKRTSDGETRTKNLEQIPIMEILESPLDDGIEFLEINLKTDKQTYKQDDTLILQAEMINPHRPFAMNGYLVVKPDQGSPLFFNGLQYRRATDKSWFRWWSKALMPQTTSANIHVPLFGWKTGSYTWYFLVTDARLSSIRGRVATAFVIEP